MKGKNTAVKKRVKDIENSLGVGKLDARNLSRVYWGPDELIEWFLPNGEIEKITVDEYEKRGGYLITWKDEE